MLRGHASSAVTLPALSGLAPRPCARFVPPDHGLVESLREHSAGTSEKCGGFGFPTQAGGGC